MRPWRHWLDWLGRPVSGLSLGVFRASVGLVLALAAWELLDTSSGVSYLKRTLSGESVGWLVPFAGFEWVRPWPEPWMTLSVFALLAAALLLTLGLCSRVMAGVCCVVWTHVWLCDAVNFNNHYYLMSLFAFLLAVMPSGQRVSLDAAIRRRVTGRDPLPIPAWPVHLLRAQLGIVYVFGGVTKITADYVLRGEPVRYFLERARILDDLEGKISPESLASLQALLTAEPMVRFVSMTGLLFDIAILPMLLWRRTRLAAIAFAFAFHAFNHFVLFSDIGVFPLLGVVSTLVFLEADWPSRLWRRLRRQAVSAETPVSAGGTSLRPVAGALVAAWIVVQAILPMRPWIIPGDADLTAEGMLFGWRMKNSVRARDLHSVIVRDSGLVTGGIGEKPSVDWPAWTGPRMMLRHVPAEAVPWETLPAIVVVREPIIGERIVFNPFSPAAQDEPFTSIASVSTAWLAATGREPDIARTIPFVDAVTAIGTATAMTGPEAVRVVLQRLAERLRERGTDLSETDRFVHDRRVRRSVAALLGVARIGDATQRALEICHPFSAWGASSPESFGIIQDPAAYVRNGAFRTVDRASVEPFWDDADLVVVDLRLLDGQDMSRLPVATPMRLADDDVAFWWNVAADSISRERANWVAVYPQCLQLYARHVASVWRAEHGRRPVVQGRFYARVNRGEIRLLTDGIADLASEPVRRFSHASWIVPRDDYPPPATLPLAY